VWLHFSGFTGKVGPQQEMVVDAFYFQFHGIVRMWDYILVVE
jgi:hypothetical protein